MNFTLEVTEGGCYKWSSSRNDVVRLTPLADDESMSHCSSKAILSTIAGDLARNTVIIFAEDLSSGLILRCDVIVDVIASLSILTTTRELFMEEAPEAFEVRANDAQGNEFTTLEGVQFQWNISSWSNREHSDGMASTVLRFITFANSPYETPPTVKELDSNGLRGHIVLLEGLKTGSAKVSVALPHEEYEFLTPIEVQLTVMSNLIIVPSDIHMLVGDSVQYQVLMVLRGHLEKITLPSVQYYLEVEDAYIAALDENAPVVTCLKLGKTKVVLHDRNSDETEDGVKLPSATLVVSEPAYLTLTILPHRNWAVMIGHHYEIIVEVFDSEHHKFHIGGGVEISTLIPVEYFQVENNTPNGTYWYGTPLESGTAQVRSTLTSVVDSSGQVHPISPRISAQANLMIYQSVSVHPVDVVLPWDNIIKPKYTVSLKASGGDGNFIWDSGNTSVATVSQTGLAQTLCDGTVEVWAAMNINLNNRGISRFYILLPENIEIVEYMLEVELGEANFLHIALFAERTHGATSEHHDSVDMIPFTQCMDLPFVVRIWDDNFQHNVSLHTPPVGISCATIAIVSTGLGTSKITVSYASENDIFEDSVVVASYRPLVSMYPASGETVLAVGSSTQIVFSGGPRPWIGRPSEHIRRIETGEELAVVEVKEVEDVIHEHDDVYVYTVLCKQLGEAEVTLTVTNMPAVKHCKRSESTATVRVLCAKPRYITLEAELHLPEGTVCPINFNPERIVAQNYKEIDVTVVVKDEQGRKFDSISSLQIDWVVSEDRLASIQQLESVLTEYVEEGNLNIPLRQYQIVIPNGKSGILELTATIVGYRTEVLESLEIIPEYPPFAILDEKGYEMTPEISFMLSVILVDDTVITPNHTTLFNHPNNKLLLQVSQGSGYYEFVLSSEDVAEVIYKEGSQIIEFIPKNDGLLKIALVDLCLPSKPAMAEIQVLGIGSIKVDIPERVEKGRCVTAVVHLFDTIDNVLPVPDVAFLDLRPVLETGIISVKMQYDKDKMSKASLAGEVHFLVTGLELGDKRLSFVAGSGAREVQSIPVSIQVFPPLRLLPRDVILVVGSVFQISSRGGPQPDANIEFSISDSIAKVNKKGLVEGLSHGKIVLIARAVGYNKATSQRMIYSQDTIEVHVIPLSGVKIGAPLIRIMNGATMPLWAQGIPDQLNPLIIGATHLPLKFSWSLSCREFAALNNVFHEALLSVPETDLASVRLTALKPGRTTVYLNATVPSEMTEYEDEAEIEFQASLDIEVFEELRLIQPVDAGELQSPFILMAPDSQVQLKTNHEGALTFTLLEKTNTLPREYGENSANLSLAIGHLNPIVTVSQDGLVTSHNNLGQAVVVVSVKEEFGLKQVMSVTVEVKPVHYLMINYHSEFHVIDGETVSGLPKGSTIQLKISYHDNTGAIFTATMSEIKLRINRFDLAKLGRGKDKDTVDAHLMHTGTTMLKIWDDLSLQHACDYIKINVEVVILPAVSAVTLGDILCFTIPLISTDDRTGYWSSDNLSVMNINSELGIGRARLVGSVVVGYHLSADFVTTIEFRVLPVHKVKILPMKEKVITNSDPEAYYKVPIVLCSEIHKLKDGTMISKNGTCPKGYIVTAYPFCCTIQFTNLNAAYDVDDIFGIHQDFDIETGEYSCNIVPSGDPPPNLSFLESNLSLLVESGGIESQPTILHFLPAIYVNTLEIHLSEAQKIGTLIINGVPTVLELLKVTSTDPMIIVSLPDSKSFLHAYTYRVQVSDHYWQAGELSARMNLTILSEITKQFIQIPIRIHLGGDKFVHSPCLVSHVSNWGSYISEMLYSYWHTIIVLSTLFLVLVVSIYGYFAYVVPLNEYTRRGSVYQSAPFMLGRQSMVTGRVQSGVGQQSMVARSSVAGRVPILGQQSTVSRSPFQAQHAGVSFNLESPIPIRRQPFLDGEPVYGDPRFFSGTSDLHHRRAMS